MALAYKIYQRDLGIEECIYQTSDELIEMYGFQNYQIICNQFGIVIENIIYVKCN